MVIFLDTKVDTKRAVRITLASVVLALLAMWASLAYFAISSRNADLLSERRVLERMATAVQEQSNHLLSFLSYFLVSADQWLVKHPNADPRVHPDFLQMVQTFKGKTNGMIDIRLVSESGELFYLGRSDKKPLAKVADRDYFRAQMQPESRGLFIAKPVLSRVTGLWGLPVSYPLQSRPHGMAVIFAAIENRVLETPYEAARTKPGGSIVLAHRDGTILFRAPMDNSVGRSVARGQLIAHELPLHPDGVYEVQASAVDGRARIVAYSSLADYPIVVSVSSAKDDVLASWRDKVKGVLVFGIVVTALALWGLRWMIASLQALGDMGKKLQVQANVDFLTHVPNRRHFMEQGKQEVMRALRYKRMLSCLMFDLDHFKSVNDQYGHAVGDMVLREVCSAVQSELRDEDLLGRLGGEEFGVLLPETNLAHATEVAERIRKHIENLALHNTNEQALPVSVSIGVVEWGDTSEDLTQLLIRADQALYQAKNAGRNKVCAQ